MSTGTEMDKEIVALGPDPGQCTYCNGDGRFRYIIMSNPYGIRESPCPSCGGSGRTIDIFRKRDEHGN